jgi:hypothetical protein
MTQTFRVFALPLDAILNAAREALEAELEKACEAYPRTTGLVACTDGMALRGSC